MEDELKTTGKTWRLHEPRKGKGAGEELRRSIKPCLARPQRRADPRLPAGEHRQPDHQQGHDHGRGGGLLRAGDPAGRGEPRHGWVLSLHHLMDPRLRLPGPANPALPRLRRR